MIDQDRVAKIAQAAIDKKGGPLIPQEVVDLAFQIVIDDAVEESAKELGWMLKDLDQEEAT